MGKHTTVMLGTVVSQVRGFITSNFLMGNSVSLKDSDSFLENGVVDSTGILELINHLESNYGLEISEEETIPQNLDSLINVANFVVRKLGSE